MNSGDLKQVFGGGTHDPMWNPNGVALSEDEQTLYATSRSETSSDFDGQRTMYTLEISSHALSVATLFAYTDTGFPDGVKTDNAGNVYGGVTDSVDVWDHEGTLLGKIKVTPGDVAVNMQFAGEWFYFVGRDSLYRVKLTTGNAQTYPV
jgi:gluconolactonase